MWNRPGPEELAKIPVFYSTEKLPLKEKMIYMHIFLGGCDWYAAEYDPESRIFFGFAILNDDLEMAEWGYFSLQELCDVKVEFLEVDRDLHFEPQKAMGIERIKRAERW